MTDRKARGASGEGPSRFATVALVGAGLFCCAIGGHDIVTREALIDLYDFLDVEILSHNVTVEGNAAVASGVGTICMGIGCFLSAFAHGVLRRQALPYGIIFLAITVCIVFQVAALIMAGKP